MSKFTIGNLYSLGEEPTKKGLSVYEALKKFHSDYYSANIMTATIISKDSLLNLEKIVTDKFKVYFYKIF